MTCDADGLTVGDVLAPTGITALFDTPVSEVLDGLGLPRFDAPAQVGLPDLSSLNLRSFPSITGIDPVSLMKPIVDLLGTFGTGSMSGGADPVASLGGLAGLLRSGASALLDAASSVDIDWAGQAAAAAIGAATRTAGQSEQVAAQGTAMASDVASAGAIVGAGFTRLQSVVAKTAGLLAAAAPALATPPGQIAALGIAAEGLTEGLAVVAETRAQLVAPTAHIAGVGAPVSVSDPPTALTGDTWSTLLQQAGPLFRAGVQIAGSLLGVDGDAAPESDVAVGGDETASTAATSPDCCAPCATATAPTTPQSTTAVQTSAAPSATVRPAASTPAVQAVDTPATSLAETPIELVDRPVTSNATVVADTGPASISTAAPVSYSGVPPVPMTSTAVAAAGRAVDPTPLRLTETSPATPEADPTGTDLATLLAQPFGAEVALRLGTDTTDFAGSV
ncbi:hypothetical protein GCM10023197_03520 [Gordonia humi]|uniref:Uncharacterized protein n=2 Tax=Gordonia humi TaxID=686429 RepID=A0A840F6Z2_9ACTN|nr:hypothetical protein [Gordonia humi]MBB4137646.1 hypothetical protein [Gordonia humi]